MSREDVAAIIDCNLPNLPGWCTPEKGRRMAELSYGASLCVELGVFGGRGLLAMALALRDQGSGRADGIDPYTKEAALEGTNDPANDAWWGHLDYNTIALMAQDLVNRQAPYARLLRLTSREAVKLYDDGSIDVIHQDSNHSQEVSCEEVSLWVPKMRASGAVWIFDDTNWPSTQKAQRNLEATGFMLSEDHESWRVYTR